MENAQLLQVKRGLLAWVSICFIQMHGYRGCLETERTALLEIKRFFIAVRDTGYKDEILTSWVDDEMSDCCRWEQVKCVNATTRRVKELSLDGITLGANSGFLNLSMFLPFQELESLDLSYNSFYGVYEKEGMYLSIGSLKWLKILNLYSNNVNNSLLPSLTTIISLTNLSLGYCGIEGFIPNQGMFI
ncbi:hypothetical protein CISIN_1g036330mg [Citrus sinensis]|uniref:Leucine-rich repeat-containing N-terminal plant-type domain-containing protein n=1 Tax=Citrus sinensis TaxID=2711 RepID=A0A067DF07_CITSI|nr:hypothetical protein CISIN_1g036330mg [Citrus sinensis]